MACGEEFPISAVSVTTCENLIPLSIVVFESVQEIDDLLDRGAPVAEVSALDFLCSGQPTRFHYATIDSLIVFYGEVPRAKELVEVF